MLFKRTKQRIWVSSARFVPYPRCPSLVFFFKYKKYGNYRGNDLLPKETRGVQGRSASSFLWIRGNFKTFRCLCKRKRGWWDIVHFVHHPVFSFAKVQALFNGERDNTPANKHFTTPLLVFCVNYHHAQERTEETSGEWVVCRTTRLHAKSRTSGLTGAKHSLDITIPIGGDKEAFRYTFLYPENWLIVPIPQLDYDLFFLNDF